jgi:hypothetical protein
MMNREDSLTQKLMSEAYKTWEGRNDWSYSDFVNSLDHAHCVAVVIGNLNYQVENGGFSQWHGNGYSAARHALREALGSVGTETALKAHTMMEHAALLMVRADKASARGNDDEADRIADKVDELDTAFYALNDRLLNDVEAYLTARGVLAS